MLKDYLSLIRFSHTVFALPFAALSVVWAMAMPVTSSNALPLSGQGLAVRCVGVLLCMVAARSAAMAFNRLVDQKFDAGNPRTANRHLPMGILTRFQVWCFFGFCCLAFIASTLFFLPNRLPMFLSVPVLMWICGYSYAKRFTWMVHLWLGTALAMAPICAWVAIRGEFVSDRPTDLMAACLLGLAVAFWVAGFDIIYSCQDEEFDRSVQLRSIPARFGVRGALKLAAMLHLFMWLTLTSIPWLVPELGLSWLYHCGLIMVAFLLIRQHWLVNPLDLSRVNEAFFTMNAIISFGVTTIAGIDACLHLA